MVLLSFGRVTLAGADPAVRVEMVTPAGELRYGAEVELRCAVCDIDESYTISWQYMDGGAEAPVWISMGVTGDTLIFVLDRVNVNYYYRAVVLC